jgi:hypothetical protein
MATPDEEFMNNIEKDMPVSVPQFKTKEEIYADVRRRVQSRGVGDNNQSLANSSERTADTSGIIQPTIRGDQGDNRGYPEHGSRANLEGHEQAHALHAGDGRDASGTGGSNGYSDDTAISDRVNANIGGSPNKYDRSTSEPGRKPLFTKKDSGSKRVSGGSFKSRMRNFVNTAFPNTQTQQTQTETPKARVSDRSIGGSGGGRGKYKTLSAEEASRLRPRLIEYITWQSEHLDSFIIATTKGHDPTIEIWGNMDEAEIEILTDYLLSRARHDPVTAQAVRFASEILDRIKVGIIVLPRVYRTVTLYFARGLDIPIWVR